MTVPDSPQIIIPFTPVPLARQRHDGWTRRTQQRFIDALGALGSVGQAARAVGMTRASAYRLRARPGADSFAAAWDQALDIGRARMFDVAMTRALDGHTTIRITRGGAFTLEPGVARHLVAAAIRDAPPLPASKAP
ncbi:MULTISPECIES: hypothetical protein [Sphingobium]|jgi:hypothetical protein|uniref:hypothetical protein n=1 Tax=Sphingobium TaxID=165695 RepID=UPI0007F3CABC|nr:MULTISPECIES: hypothetical protein [Sphingobium]MBS48967.1 hypothetical protein [Sphingobium sp.]MEC9017444.1 hypothetical protein [Pseudomonadota bacterium]MCC4256290.1 hypothetical protein [Sphingobium lactosutens]OAN52675.1 hypothetical protein A7Q26_07680 [Sphingobium sp. TCM1]HCW62006.1 hypothetical protein [Sphingobium sp.]|tara:strand:- start:4283 stop:4690 length:408 start_codon:yes stop_codon:yes gene_type:complete